jgi:hypothetical protein
MTPREKAISLVDSYRNILMNEDTECGNEILCTLIAMKCALIAVDEILSNKELLNHLDYEWWNEVKHEIEKL